MTVIIGDVYSTNNCGDVKIISYKNARNVGIEFLNTGFQCTTRKASILKGYPKDPYNKTLCGVGFIGEGEYTAPKQGGHAKIYKCWSHMLERCYSPQFHSYNRYGGRGVYVADEWFNYQNFAKWYEANHKEGLELDKDLKGKKYYGEDSCVFLPKEINVVFTLRTSLRGEYPVGVSKQGNSFQAGFSKYGKSFYVGCYSTPEEAFQHYKVEKESYIKDLAKKHLKLGNISNEVYKLLLMYEVVPYPE